MVTLRQLSKNDITHYRRVRLFGLRESPTAFGASYSQEEKMLVEEMAKRLEPTSDCWVIGAFEETELIGVIGFVREGGDKSRHKGFIWGMYVMPAFRGKGVGRTLFEEALKRIEALPALRQVKLSVVTSNLSALRLYEKFGFRTFGEEADSLCVDGAFHAELHMARMIDGPSTSRSPR